MAVGNIVMKFVNPISKKPVDRLQGSRDKAPTGVIVYNRLFMMVMHISDHEKPKAEEKHRASVEEE